MTYADQAGVSIAIDDARLNALHTSGLHGRFDIARALQRLLAGSGYGFTFIDARTVRVFRLPPAVPPQRKPSMPVRPPLPVVAAQPPLEVHGPDIVVSATKQEAGLADYPSGISVVTFDDGDRVRGAPQGTDYILRRMPGLASTNLGPGRNKIFIRGIADSSFNGASQSTISQYLGEARLIYSAPDPDLLLYDVEGVEVLEGPQGTLYGAGTLGGIIRTMPREPDLTQTSLAMSSGVRITQHGAPGGDIAGVLNLPVSEELGLRVVGYASREGGYIDDTLRGLQDINRTGIIGLRASLRWMPAADWTIDFRLLRQDLASRDGQYSEANVGPLARRSVLAQPFDNDYRLAAITLAHDWGGMKLVSATSYTHHSIDTVFDATPVGQADDPQVYSEDLSISLFSHESRLSGELGSRGQWLGGFSLVDNIQRTRRRLGPETAPGSIADVRNATFDAALFGEATAGLPRGFSLTLGGRLDYVRSAGELMGQQVAGTFEPTRQQFRALPTAALSWKPRPDQIAYVRYQEGYRPGALEITGTGAEALARRFERDHIHTLELGWRFGAVADARLSGGIAASSAIWTDIQADLVDADGLPYIANIGSGRVRNIGANLTWRPSEAITLEGSGFLAWSDLTHPAPGFDEAQDRDLPNIADRGWRLAARHEASTGPGNLVLEAALRYVGHSQLAVRPPFDLAQGGYYDLTFGARYAVGRIGISFDLGNLLDTRANTFAFGNPFSAANGNQTTPPRPRSIRLGVDARF